MHGKKTDGVTDDVEPLVAHETAATLLEAQQIIECVMLIEKPSQLTPQLPRAPIHYC
jgi:hypothetical protein